MHPFLTPTFDRSTPFFSIIILYWNNRQYLQKCLDCLNAQTFQDFEVLVMDNGSKDAISEEDFSELTNLKIRLIRLHKNIGYAAGNNLAASRAKGNYLALLNADAFPEPDWLKMMHDAANRHPGCSFASQQILAGDPTRFDGEGDVYHISGLVWRRSFRALISDTKHAEGEVFSACGAAAVYPRFAYEQVGGFDEDYFAYIEDVDLGFRMRLAGYKCIYIPTAMVFHAGSASSKSHRDFSVYYNQRNLVWTFFKDMPGSLLFLFFPLHLLTNFMLVILCLLKKQGRTCLQAKLDALLKLPYIIQKRRGIHQKRQVSIFHIISTLNWNLFTPIIRLFHR